MKKVAIASLLCALGLIQSVAALDLKRGALLFQTCAACHSVLGDQSIGPNIVGIYGKKAGQDTHFRYSTTMVKSNLIWDDETLRTFVTNPQALVKDTTMTFPGYMKAEDAADVIAYLKTLK